MSTHQQKSPFFVLAKSLIEELLLHECRILDNPALAVLLKAADPDEAFHHCESLPDGRVALWHKRFWVQSEHLRAQNRAYIKRLEEASTQYEYQMSHIKAIVKTRPEFEIMKDTKKFDNLINAMLDKIRSGQASALAEMLGLRPEDIPQPVNYKKI